MNLALVFNPGSNSLKFELLELQDSQKVASEAKKLVSASLDDIGKQAQLSVYNGRNVVEHHAANSVNMTDAVHTAIHWLRKQEATEDKLEQLTMACVRVVHGGSLYSGAVRFNDKVRRDIEELEELAPLHNQSSLEILDALGAALSKVSVFVTFDTAFHRTLPEKAWRYPIERELADRNGIRKYGFHGVSHRYMLEQYAHLCGKDAGAVSIVTLHLESGSSACAIANGRSVDTTMGLTPLEGLMMGTRSGSVDPAIVPYIMQKERKSVDEAMEILNKHSGLLGIAGGSLDTRELVKRSDDAAKLALRMFSYRVRLAAGAYLAALRNAEAVVFGGGIGEDSPWLREDVCEGLTGWSLELDPEVNQGAKKGTTRISKDSSRLHAWAMPAEECLQIAHECALAMR